RSEKGCLVVTREQTQAIPASRIERVVDATGAGDLFAAGFLTGLSRGADYRAAARLGALVAAEVVQHLGARPETSLKALAQDNGFGLGRTRAWVSRGLGGGPRRGGARCRVDNPPPNPHIGRLSHNDSQKPGIGGPPVSELSR